MTDKTGRLEEILRSLKKTAVAFSGGTDSALLAAAAVRALGAENVFAVTAVSATLTGGERADAKSFVEQFGIRHEFVETNEFADEKFTANDADRCYYCKRIRFTELIEFAASRNFDWVIEGSNVDDDSDYRPGARAIAELPAVRSPLKEAGFTKTEIRELSRRWNLPTAEKPAAACLASRIKYGLPLTPERLAQVEAAETFIRPFCRGQLRVRHHGDSARIETETPAALEAFKNQIDETLKSLGFKSVIIDSAGYRMGSLNEELKR